MIFYYTFLSFSFFYFPLLTLVTSNFCCSFLLFPLFCFFASFAIRSGECGMYRELYRGKTDFYKGHQACVKRRATLSLSMSGVCKVMFMRMFFFLIIVWIVCLIYHLSICMRVLVCMCACVRACLSVRLTLFLHLCLFRKYPSIRNRAL